MASDKIIRSKFPRFSEEGDTFTVDEVWILGFVLDMASDTNEIMANMTPAIETTIEEFLRPLMIKAKVKVISSQVRGFGYLIIFSIADTALAANEFQHWPWESADGVSQR